MAYNVMYITKLNDEKFLYLIILKIVQLQK